MLNLLFPGYICDMEHADEVMVVLCAFPDGETARQIGTFLVERQLAACVNLVSGTESIYRWEGVVEQAPEVTAWIKTTRGRYQELETAIKAAHPYQVPEILALPVALGFDGYLGWVRESLGG